MTDNFLFKNKPLGIPVCSKKCEFEYLNELTPEVKEQIGVLSFLDETIEKNRKIDRLLWSISGGGAIVVIISFILGNAIIFLAGALIASIGTLLTKHFEDKVEKLTKERKRIAI
jgi:hypothetical protein